MEFYLIYKITNNIFLGKVCIFFFNDYYIQMNEGGVINYENDPAVASYWIPCFPRPMVGGDPTHPSQTQTRSAFGLSSEGEYEYDACFALLIAVPNLSAFFSKTFFSSHIFLFSEEKNKHREI